mmetsp:Transcript_64028/g.93742  ORF Transcript_64028/g.93742 Transcript_64028/m.93742 type:complete len:188 (+) Transcript_64028:1613-2176(+)
MTSSMRSLVTGLRLVIRFTSSSALNSRSSVILSIVVLVLLVLSALIMGLRLWFLTSLVLFLRVVRPSCVSRLQVSQVAPPSAGRRRLRLRLPKRKGGRSSAGARPTTAAAVKKVKVKPAGQINLTRGPGTDRGVERKMGEVPGISLGICDSVWCTKSHWCNRSHEGTGREAGAGSGAGQGSGAGPVT